MATSSAQVRASCPKVGSSSTSTRGLVAMAAATVSRRFSPPESVYGLAAARWARRRRASSLVAASGDLVVVHAERPWPDGQFLAHGLREQLMLRLLEHHADAGQQIPRAPADRRGLRTVREERGCLDRSTRWRKEPGEGQTERRLARPVGSGDRERLPRVHIEVDTGGDRTPLDAGDGQVTRREQGLPWRPERGRWRGGRMPRHPDAVRGQLRTTDSEDFRPVPCRRPHRRSRSRSRA